LERKLGDHHNGIEEGERNVSGGRKRRNNNEKKRGIVE